MQRIAFHTLGCKLNFAETSDLARKFQEKGYTSVDFREQADIYVINTCTVTALAEKKCRTAIRQAIQTNPNAKIAVVGCFSQLSPKQISSIEGVDYVLGNADKHKLVDYITADNAIPCHCLNDGNILDIAHVKEFVPSYSANDRTRSFLKIQDGCDYFCTYCAIPFSRGRNRSDTIAGTVSKVNEIVAAGIKEVVLTGVNIGEFGTEHQESFFGLMKALDKIEGIERYRISSIEPNLLTAEMIDFVAQSNSFLPHFHIPLQSGSDKILSLMKRRYKRELFTSVVEKIKSKMPQACIAADVIVGFAGETDKDFEDVYAYIDGLPLSYLHVFTYSERPGSQALKFSDKVPVSVRRERSKQLHNLSKSKKQKFYEDNTDSTHSVLWESDNENGQMYGFTENYIRTKKKYDLCAVNTIEKIRLTHLNENAFDCISMN